MRVDDAPALPAAYHDAVSRGLASLGLDLDEAALAAIHGHARLLLAWNRAINLTAIDEPERVATLHVIDSLAAVSVLRERGVDEFVDLGSGGGYPGLPLAVALPARRALLVDSVGKKARFLATATEAVGLTGVVDVFTGRAEALAADRAHRERWQAVTARAVAALADLVELSFPLLRSGGMLVAWKRGDIRDEVAAGRRAAAALGGGTIEVVESPGSQAGDRLVLATKRGRTDSSYPRDPAVRRRMHW